MQKLYEFIKTCFTYESQLKNEIYFRSVFISKRNETSYSENW